MRNVYFSCIICDGLVFLSLVVFLTLEGRLFSFLSGSCFFLIHDLHMWVAFFFFFFFFGLVNIRFVRCIREK
jgi:hypothetical protein